MRRWSIGALRHRLVIEAPLRTSDGGGGGVVSWLDAGEVWAAIEPLSGSEAIVAEAVSGRISHAITIRHRPDVVPTMRFRQGDRIFDIAAAIDLDERGRMLRCLCREEGL